VIAEIKPRLDLKRPSELLGYPFEDRRAFEAGQQEVLGCPFMKTECIKRRHYAREVGKHMSSGICTVWYDGLPHVTCSKRALQNNVIFNVAGEAILGSNDFVVLPERGLGEYGKVDFVIVKPLHDKKILDFFG